MIRSALARTSIAGPLRGIVLAPVFEWGRPLVVVAGMLRNCML